MTFYDEIDIDDMDFDEDSAMYSFPCPCGDQFLLHLVGVPIWSFEFWLSVTGQYSYGRICR